MNLEFLMRRVDLSDGIKIDKIIIHILDV